MNDTMQEHEMVQVPNAKYFEKRLADLMKQIEALREQIDRLKKERQQPDSGPTGE